MNTNFAWRTTYWLNTHKPEYILDKHKHSPPFGTGDTFKMRRGYEAV